ncbi:hypothetical protein WJX74_001466 [Apatococcus lobatus]|uniref:Uncharacterized protein n=1 Tax=Apatococcus lobatus TaxID=904363 RepID=A0AAW1RGI5_9CHLO
MKDAASLTFSHASASLDAKQQQQPPYQPLHNKYKVPLRQEACRDAGLLPSNQEASPVRPGQDGKDLSAPHPAKSSSPDLPPAWSALHDMWEAAQSPRQDATRMWRKTASGVSGGRASGGAAAWGASERIGAWRGLTAIEAALAGTREQLDHCHDQVRPRHFPSRMHS